MVKIPPQLKPEAKAVTVAQQRDIKTYGSLEAARAVRLQESVKAEVISVGLDKISSVGDYEAKYNKLTPTARQYFDTPAQFSASVEAQKIQTIESNKILINEKVAYYTAKRDAQKQLYQERARIAEAKGNESSARAYQNKAEEEDAYYDGIIDGLRSGVGLPASYSDISSYAKELGRYERDKQEARNKQQDFKYQRPKETKDEWSQRLVEQTRQQGLTYLEEHPSAWSSPSTITVPKKGPKVSTEIIKGVSVGPMVGAQVFTPSRDRKLLESPTSLGQGTSIFLPAKPAPPETRKVQTGVTYLGGEEIRTTIQPSFQTPTFSGFGDVGIDERVDVRISNLSADYSTSIKKKILERAPLGGGTAITQQDEPVYLPTQTASDKFAKLLEEGSGPKTRKFLREQQAQLKRDIGRYNVLRIKNEAGTITDKEFTEAEKLRISINQGSRGTLGDIVYAATEGATQEGEKTDIFGMSVSPRTARRGLIGGVAGVNVLSDVLAAQVGVGLVAPIVPAAALKGIGVASKYLAPPIGAGLGVASGFGEYGKHQDIGDAFASGVGTSAGFFGGVYSKQIVEGTGKGLTKISRFAHKPLSPMDKKAMVQSKSMYDQQANYEKAKARAKAKGTSVNEELKKINIDKELMLESIRLKLKHATKEDVLKTVKEILKSIKTSKTMTEAQKIIAARNLNNFVKDVRPDLFYTKISPLSTQQATPETAGVVASIFAGTGMYERTDTVAGLLPMSAISQQQRLFTDVMPITDQQLDTEQEQDKFSILGVISKIGSGQTQQPSLRTTPIQSPDTKQESKQETFPLFDLGGKQAQDSGQRGLQNGGKPFGFRIVGIDFGGQRRGQSQKEQSFRGEAKVKGRWKKVTDKPHTRSGAFDVVARVVDNTVAASGRVVPSKKKVSKEKIKRGDGYYNKTHSKFRNYKISKGRKVPLQNGIIEFNSKRIDQIGEKKGLSVAKFLAQRNKTPTKRKAKGKTKKNWGRL